MWLRSQRVSALFPARCRAACVVLDKSATFCASLPPLAQWVNYVLDKHCDICSWICFLKGEGSKAHKEIAELRGKGAEEQSCFPSMLYTRGRPSCKYLHSLPLSADQLHACGCSSFIPLHQGRNEDSHCLREVLPDFCRLTLPRPTSLHTAQDPAAWLTTRWYMWSIHSYPQPGSHVPPTPHFPLHHVFPFGAVLQAEAGSEARLPDGLTLRELQTAADALLHLQ